MSDCSAGMVSRYCPVLASTNTEKLLVPTDSPQITRQTGSGCLATFSSRNEIGLPGFFLSYSAPPLASAVLYAASVSTYAAAAIPRRARASSITFARYNCRSSRFTANARNVTR